MHSRFVLGILAVMVAGLAIKYYEYNRKEPLPTTTTYAQHPSSPWGVHLLQGRRPYMEDTFSTLEENPALLFGVYDGHGGDVRGVTHVHVSNLGLILFVGCLTVSSRARTLRRQHQNQ